MGWRLAIIILLLTFGRSEASGTQGTGNQGPCPETQYGSTEYDHARPGILTARLVTDGTGNAASRPTVSDVAATEAFQGDRVASGQVAALVSDTGRDDPRAGPKDAPASRVPGPLAMILLGSCLIGLAEWGRRKRGKSSFSN
jgi:hypothetical protein